MDIKNLIKLNDVFLQGLIGSGILTLVILETSGKTYTNILLSLPIFISVFALLFIRYKVNNINLFFITNFLVLVLSILCFKENLVKFVAGIYLCTIFVKSFKMRENNIESVDETPSLTASLIFVVLGFLGIIIAKGAIYGTIYSGYFLVFLAFEFLQSNLIGLNNFTDKHISIKTLPKEAIEHSNMMLMGIFMLCIVLSVFFFNNPIFTNALNGLYKLFLAVITWILKRILPRSQDRPVIREEESSVNEDYMPELTADDENLLDAIWDFLEVAAIAAIIFAIIYFGYKILKHLIHNFSGVNVAKNGDKVEFIHDDRQKEERLIRKKKTSYKHLKNNDKIRYIYFKTLKKKCGKDYSFDISKTPLELQNAIFNADSNSNNVTNSLELTKLYELARYNNDELDTSFVDNAKNLSNDILSSK